MHPLLTPLIALPLLIGSSLSLAELTPYEIRYSASMAGIPVNGEASRSFSLLANGHYQLTSEADLVLVSMHTQSTGALEQPLRPLSYSYQQGGFAKKRTRDAKFDWANKQVSSSKNDKNWILPLETGTFDELSYQAQLRYDLSQGKTELNYLVVDDDELDLFRFAITGKEIIKTPIGKLNAIKVKRMRDNNKRVTEIWFAPELDYLPIQLRQLEKGKEYRLELRSATLDGKKITAPTP